MNKSGPFGNLLIIGLVFLLCFADVSLQTSVIFSRYISISPWIFRLGPLTPADYWLLATCAYLFVIALAKRGGRAPTPSKGLTGILIAYLIIGALYNLIIYTNWKTYLYDIKAVLYFLVPYALLKVNFNANILRYIRPSFILIYCLIAACIDTGFVYLTSAPEYPEFVGIPAYANILDAGLLMIWMFVTQSTRLRLFIIALLALEVIGDINKLSLTPLFGLAYSLIYLVISRSRTKSKFLPVLMVFVIVQLIVPIALIHAPQGIMSEKSDGVATRQIQWQNYLMNAEENFTGIIGKGLGSTWFEYVPIPESDIYSVGTSMGDDVDASMATPVKFIYNFIPAGILHKFGIVGITLLVYFICKTVFKRGNNMAFGGEAALILFLLLYYLPFVGFLRETMITSIMLYWYHDMADAKSENTHF